ncbi:pyridoxal 5'-phosphate synthase glutaminase subunit PdxT [Microbacterium hominis]|uniref:pyridoxal 5'-phosphate synthase glutaminase subunit PdxT n=1 Tax=Microbacterium TaxID=33882 RepID=UPI00168BF60F|nr:MULTISPECIES: pyridoxal 5'-phosphate synthase glutaminase subunit PdxT [Microbacterium]QOC25572.1 pyridoxal 5'-phosphate synthase glutaminase subunit PdxT [Microbacterium hominis]QOC29574.1 pyridoxal 5'-phosphate synthase glutaminase subunit PdxT [Microbacterium hominis]QYF98054.1 pyridoxal 5'-phosphate synthase glutaminase subunit PdxT [Microbacterium sp. PAMC21962]
MVTTGMPRVGVLALQGDVREHVRSLETLGAEVVAVRRPAELAAVSGLVIPGGESSVIDKLARTFGLQQPIRAAIADGMPVYGTCAGLILLADRITDGIRGQETFGGLDATVQRNAFGSQVDSFETELAVAGFDEPVSATFIRAPRVVETGPDVEVLASLPDGAVVAVRQGALLGTAFHPEMSGETRFHALLLDLVAARAR